MKKLIRKLLCVAACTLMLVSFFCTNEAQAALYHCGGYGVGNNVECRIVWYPAANKMHYGICVNHVMDKEDANSHYPPVATENCSPNSDEICVTCGQDCSDSVFDPYSLEMLMFLLNEVTTPVHVGVSGAAADVEFSDQFISAAEEKGFSLGEALMVPTTYTLKLPSGNSYPYTGEAITPAVLEVSEYGPASVLQEYADLEVSDITYTNNVNPGTATAVVTFLMGDSLHEELKINFTIAGESVGSGNFIPQQLYNGSVAVGGNLSEGAKLIVTTIAAGNDGYEMLAGHVAAANQEKVAAYDVRIQGEYDGKLELDFAVGEQYNGKKLTILHGKSNGTVEVMYSTVTSGLAHVEVDGLSPFLLLNEKSESGQMGGSESGTNNLPTSAPTATPEPVKVPTTGDSSQPLLWLAMMMVALIGASVCVKSKRLNSK